MKRYIRFSSGRESNTEMGRVGIRHLPSSLMTSCGNKFTVFGNRRRTNKYWGCPEPRANRGAPVPRQPFTSASCWSVRQVSIDECSYINYAFKAPFFSAIIKAARCLETYVVSAINRTTEEDDYTTQAAA